MTALHRSRLTTSVPPVEYDAPAGMMLEMPILELVTTSSKHSETAKR
jgi:hypothetical protein